MHRGYVKLWRCIEDNPRSSDPHWIALWDWCLRLASHRPTDVIFGLHRMTLQPGQFVTSRKALSQRTGIQESKIERLLRCLETDQQIEQRTCSRSRVITILNWAQYQMDEQPVEHQMNSSRTAVEHIQECKKEEELEFSLRSNSSKKSEPTSPGVLSRDFYMDTIEKYNTVAKSVGLPVVQKLSDTRRKAINARHRDGMLGQLDAILVKVEKSEFLCGISGRDSWKGATFDWLFLSPHNWVKVIEGKYDNKDGSEGKAREIKDLFD